MTETIKQQVRHILTAETTSLGIADKLFTQGGLFSQMANSKVERQAVSRSPLFREAQARMRDLQHAEAARFSQAIQTLQRKSPASCEPANAEQTESR